MVGVAVGKEDGGIGVVVTVGEGVAIASLGGRKGVVSGVGVWRGSFGSSSITIGGTISAEPSTSSAPVAVIKTGPNTLLFSLGHSLTVLSVSAWAHSWCEPLVKVKEAL
jgi:hypothetical protein